MSPASGLLGNRLAKSAVTRSSVAWSLAFSAAWALPCKASAANASSVPAAAMASSNWWAAPAVSPARNSGVAGVEADRGRKRALGILGRRRQQRFRRRRVVPLRFLRQPQPILRLKTDLRIGDDAREDGHGLGQAIELHQGPAAPKRTVGRQRLWASRVSKASKVEIASSNRPIAY